MKIAILTSGILPVPAVQGGAVENLIEFYLSYNEVHKIHDITVFSVFHKKTLCSDIIKSRMNHFIYINTNSIMYKLKRIIYSTIHKNETYNYQIEFFFEQAYKSLSKGQYDLIILENRPGYSIKLANRLKTPQIAHIHYDMLNNPFSINIYKNILGIVSVSNYLYKNAPKEIRHKCTTVYNGIDLSKFSPITSIKRKENRRQYDIKETDIVLVYCGRIDPIKGVKELIESIILINDPHIKLLIIGGSYYENNENISPYILSVMNLAESIKNQVIFTGFRPYSEVPKLLALADIATIPSICNDAFPTIVLEAMATGLPIIASNRGGIPEQVNKENAILIDTDQNMIQNLSKAIYKLAHNPELRKNMCKASLKKVQYFSKERYAKDFFNTINNFIIT